MIIYNEKRYMPTCFRTRRAREGSVDSRALTATSTRDCLVMTGHPDYCSLRSTVYFTSLSSRPYATILELCALTTALYKSFTYLLTYLLTYKQYWSNIHKFVTFHNFPPVKLNALRATHKYNPIHILFFTIIYSINVTHWEAEKNKYTTFILKDQPVKYTMSQKKVSQLMFDNNFGKCGLIFKILLPGDSYGNSLCIYHKDFHLTCNMLLHYLVKVRNPKCYPIFTLKVTINMFN